MIRTPAEPEPRRESRVNDTRTAIRLIDDQDEPAVVGVWHRSGRAAYRFLPTWQALTLERAGEIFRDVIRPHCNIWVGTRQLYETHGFGAVKFGVSPPPESAPDVEYHWRPDDV